MRKCEDQVYYCSSCGEPGDGRFCRMCGTALGPGPDPDRSGQLSSVAATQVTATAPGPGAEFDGLFRSSDSGWSQTDPTRVLPNPGVPAGHGGPAPEYGAEYGTEYSAEYAGGYESAPGYGVPGYATPDYTVTDYNMAPPGAVPPAGTMPGAMPGQGGMPGPMPMQASMSGTLPMSAYAATTAIPPQSAPGMPVDGYPPPPNGYDENWGPDEDESDRPRKGIIYGTLGAVAVAIAVICALLYLGTPGPAPNSNNAGALNPTSGAQSTQPLNPLQLPSALPTTPPTTQAPPTTQPATNPANGNSALPLSLGSTGNLVKYVQQRLQQLRLYNGPDNGLFDQTTAGAVQHFQAEAHVQGDPASVVGRSTMTALVAAGSQPVLKVNSHNDNPGDVKRLQAALDYAENAGLSSNGSFTASTWAAVTRYQVSVGLAPTGEVDGQTWSKLQAGDLAS